jgi:hypothetical protein
MAIALHVPHHDAPAIIDVVGRTSPAVRGPQPGQRMLSLPPTGRGAHPQSGVQVPDTVSPPPSTSQIPDTAVVPVH